MTAECKNKELLRMRVDYWIKRLDHTITHTQTSSRLIYLIDGAVLAFLYFLINAFGSGRNAILFLSIPVLVLSVLNLFHAEFISIQLNWYRGIDSKLLDLLGQDKIEHTKRSWYQFSSAHGVYRCMHFLIAAFLSALFLLMLLYGLGMFTVFDLVGHIDKNLSALPSKL